MIVLYTKDGIRITLHKHSASSSHIDAKLFTPNSVYFKSDDGKWILCNTSSTKEVVKVLRSNTYEKAVSILSL